MTNTNTHQPTVLKTLLPLSQSASDRTAYSGECVIIELCDTGGGPFLMVHGRTEWGESGSPPGAFIFDSLQQVDAFAERCRLMLQQYGSGE